MRICSRCKTAKPIERFYSHPLCKPNGTRKQCKDCTNEYKRSVHKKNPTINRNRNNAYAAANRDKLAEWQRLNRKNAPDRHKGYQLKKSFGITLEQFKKMEADQKSLCALCNQPEKTILKSGKIKHLAVDHDHNTGLIRKLLCWECNTAIGKLNHDPELLRKAAAYIEKHKLIAP